MFEAVFCCLALFRCTAYVSSVNHFSPHRMHEMQTIATDGPITWCLSLFVMSLCPAKKAEHIEVLFGVETLWDPRHIVLDWIVGGSRSSLTTGRGSGGKFCPL